ncbi:MAG: hypothetical protein F6K61_21475 [Sphaerospermopsis sp. SIO1G1]|nr:hypothetical protein [Sphaerospermopsis sp. SIO1G1]
MTVRELIQELISDDFNLDTEVKIDIEGLPLHGITDIDDADDGKVLILDADPLEDNVQ